MARSRLVTGCALVAALVVRLDRVPGTARVLLLILLRIFADCVLCCVYGQVGYTQTTTGGEMALTTGTGDLQAIEEGADTANLSGGQGSSGLNVQSDFGVPVVSTSRFRLRDVSKGQLADSFGASLHGAIVDSALDVPRPSSPCRKASTWTS